MLEKVQGTTDRTRQVANDPYVGDFPGILEDLASRDAAGKPPERDLTWDALRGVFRGDYPVTVHTQWYQVVQKTIVMLHDHFRLRVVLDHSTFEGFKTASMVAERGIYTIVGPRQYWLDRSERVLRSVTTTGIATPALRRARSAARFAQLEAEISASGRSRTR